MTETQEILRDVLYAVWCNLLFTAMLFSQILYIHSKLDHEEHPIWANFILMSVIGWLVGMASRFLTNSIWG